MVNPLNMMFVLNLVFLVPAAILCLLALVIGGVEMTTSFRRYLRAH